MSKIKVFTLFSGSSGNSTLICTNSTNILIDAGVSCSRILSSLKLIGLNPSEIDGVLLTHEHQDHISGAGVLARRHNISIYSSKKTLEGTICSVGEVYDHTLKTVKPGEPFEIRDLVVYPFSIPHDASDPMGFSVVSDNTKISVATDLGHISKSVLKNLCKSDIALIESNHDTNMLQNGSYPYFLKNRIMGDNGHLSNDKAAWLATQLAMWGTKKIVLGHLSSKNNLPDLAYKTTYDMLVKNNFQVEKDVVLKIAPKNAIMEI